MGSIGRNLVVVTVAAVAILGMWAWRLREPPAQRAYRVCAACADLRPADVVGLIDSVRQSNQTREQSLELVRQQSAGGPADARDCEPCTMAVIEAAGK